MSSKRWLILKCFTTHITTYLLLKSTVLSHYMSLGIRFLYKVLSTDATFCFAINFGFNEIFSHKTFDRLKVKHYWKKTTRILNNFILSGKFHEFVSYGPSLTDLFCISCDTGGMWQVQIHSELSKCASCNWICSAQNAFHTGHSNNSPLQKW